MKPSERINNILGEFTLKRGSSATPQEDIGRLFESIVDYLDEEHAKKHQHTEGIKCNEC